MPDIFRRPLNPYKKWDCFGFLRKPRNDLVIAPFILAKKWNTLDTAMNLYLIFKTYAWRLHQPKSRGEVRDILWRLRKQDERRCFLFDQNLHDTWSDRNFTPTLPSFVEDFRQRRKEEGEGGVLTPWGQLSLLSFFSLFFSRFTDRFTTTFTGSWRVR